MPGVARALGATGLLLCVLLGSRAHAAETNVVIQGFEYRPDAIEIAPGDTVAWTNLDATVHTVTATDDSFDSGRLDQGQRYVLAFNQPGTYTYFCDLHEHEGVVAVGGAAPTTTTTAAPPVTTATGPPGTAPAPAATHDPSPSTTALPAPPPASAPPGPEGPAVSASDPSVGPAPAPDSTPAAFSVVSAPATTALAPLAPLAVLLAVLALTGVSATQLWWWSPGRGALARRLQGLVALLTLVSGAVHLGLRLRIEYPEPTASLFAVHAAAALVVAVALVTFPSGRGIALGLTFHAMSLLAFALSRSAGLFGFREAGWDPSPEAVVAVAAEVAGVGLLVAVWCIRRSHRRAPLGALAARPG